MRKEYLESATDYKERLRPFMKKLEEIGSGNVWKRMQGKNTFITFCGANENGRVSNLRTIDFTAGSPCK